MALAHDFVGRPIKMGDIVVYPVRRRSTMFLRKCKVLFIDTSGGLPQIVAIDQATNRRVNLKVLDNCIVVPDLK